MSFETRMTIEWGDCDEAGIVFYPNFFYWFDCTFQRWLRHIGLSQRVLRSHFGAVTPIIDAGAQFLAPARYDEEMLVEAKVEKWTERRFVIAYVIRIGERHICSGHEERAWALIESGKMKGAPIDPEFKRVLSGTPAPS